MKLKKICFFVFGLFAMFNFTVFSEADYQIDYLTIYNNFLNSKGENWKCEIPKGSKILPEKVYSGKGVFEDAYLLDLENDGIPELLTFFHGKYYGNCLIYKYINGEIVIWESLDAFRGGSGNFCYVDFVKLNDKIYIKYNVYNRDYEKEIKYYHIKIYDPDECKWTEYYQDYYTYQDKSNFYYDENGRKISENEMDFVRDVDKLFEHLSENGIELISVTDYDFVDDIDEPFGRCDRLKGKNLLKFYITDYISQINELIKIATEEQKMEYIPVLINRAFTVYKYDYFENAISLCQKLKNIPGITHSQTDEVNAIITESENKIALWIGTDINRALELYQTGYNYEAIQLCNSIKSKGIGEKHIKECDDIIELAENAIDLWIYDDINKALQLFNDSEYEQALRLCMDIRKRDLNEDQSRSCSDVILLAVEYMFSKANFAYCEKRYLYSYEILATMLNICNTTKNSYTKEIEEVLYGAAKFLHGSFNDIQIYAKSGIYKSVTIYELDDYLNTGVWFTEQPVSYEQMTSVAYDYLKKHISGLLKVPGSGYFPPISEIEFPGGYEFDKYLITGYFTALNPYGIRVKEFYVATIYYNPYGIVKCTVEIEK